MTRTVRFDGDRAVTGQEWDSAVWDAFLQLRYLQDDIDINGIALDLRDQKLLAGNWQAQGVGFYMGGPENPLSVFWARPDRLEGRSGMTPDGPYLPPHFVLEKGDKLTIESAEIGDTNDAALLSWDRLRASATVVVTRKGGTIERGAVPITFSHPNLIDDGVGLVWATVPMLRHRQTSLRALAANLPAPANQKFMLALEETEEHFRRLSAVQDDLWQNTFNKIHTLDWQQTTISQDHAAAFGYALARAEAELSTRLEVRAARKKRSEGGKARAAQLQSRANDWKIPALEIAKSLDKSAHKFSRDALTTEILIKLYEKMEPPSAATVNAWLRNEVEPKGLIRSRARQPKSAKLTR